MTDYSYSRQFARKKPALDKNLRKPKTILIIFILGLIIILVLKKLPNNPFREITTSDSSVPKFTGSTLFSNGFSENLAREVAKFKGTYSVYVFELNSGRDFGINENTTFIAASVNKVPILAALYHKAGKKEIDLDKIIVPQAEDIQDYGTGSIRYDPTGTSYSLKTLARLMMEKSDNTAAHLLGKIIIGFDKIQELTDSWGLSQTDMEENKTSARDMSRLMTKMYRGEITTPSLTSEMLDFMDDSDFEDRIPAGVADGVKVYHKIGDEIGKIHDVAIIDLPDHPYFLGVLTTDTTDEENTKKTIATISELVFKEMKKL